MIFQTEKQLKDFGDKLSDDKKKPIESALEDLKKAYESKDLEKIDETLNAINEAWKNASEEMYKAQAESGAGQPGEGGPSSDNQNTNTDSKGDDVQDVDFEEVKEE
jgi:molecular chaperone DnaK